MRSSSAPGGTVEPATGDGPVRNACSSSRSTISTAIRLARSPPRCPPIPSATAYRPRTSLHRKLSSLWSRLRPTSVMAHPRVFMSAPRPRRPLLGALPRLAWLGPALHHQVHLAGAVAPQGGQAAGLHPFLHQRRPDGLRPRLGLAAARHLDAHLGQLAV